MTHPGEESRDYSPEVVTRRVPQALAGLRLDQALARMFPEHSRSRLQDWLKHGRIRLDARAATPRQKIWGGERVELSREPDARELPARAEPIALAVVHEDEAVLVVDKPAGLVVHPGSGNWQGTLLNALLHHAPALSGVPRAGIVHRLDKDTSGLLVVAKTLEAQTALVRQLQARTVRRRYLAVVHGVVRADGVVQGAIGRDPRNRVRMALVQRGKDAVTHYRVLERYAQASLVECSLETGRTHQIRVHMQSLGHPLAGDRSYGGRTRSARGGALAAFPRQALHAAELAFLHPVSGLECRYASPLPADMRQLIDSLR